ncbi:MAG: DUF6252 family protein [Cyclobacteriaceae bacterium]|nr:DUF6252 family protein [Cyclobacteriaceae bacterium]MDW8332396.1 DUF6252 family protein [Cyclobacteriaceae bacterium]
MPIRLTVPIVLLIGLLIARIWAGETPSSGSRFQANFKAPLKENSFRCLFDNKFLEVDSITAELIRYNQRTTLILRNATQTHKLYFQITGRLSKGSFVLDNPSEAYASMVSSNEPCLFTTDEYYQGMLMIDFIDTTTGMLSGSFELLAYSDECRKVIRVQNGRFLVKYQERDIM